MRNAPSAASRARSVESSRASSRARREAGGTGRFYPYAFLKNCTSRSCCSAAARVAKVPRFFRFPVLASFFREYRRYSPLLSLRIMLHLRSPRSCEPYAGRRVLPSPIMPRDCRGDRIRREILGERRAEYGAEIVSALGRQLELEFGRGFAEKNLRRMIQFAEVFPDWEIVVSLIRHLTCTHFIVFSLVVDRL